jgi:hypothetical protein
MQPVIPTHSNANLQDLYAAVPIPDSLKDGGGGGNSDGGAAAGGGGGVSFAFLEKEIKFSQLPGGGS